MAKKLVLPRVHVMVLCDEIEPIPDDPGTYNLSGVRTKVRAETFPHVQPYLSVYLQITGHPGTTSCRLEILHAETEEVAFTTPIKKIALKGPLVVLPIVFLLKDCSFPAPGLYYVQAYCDHKLLCERLLSVSEG